MKKLFFGDNLRIMKEEIATDSVDLIYLDPPFNSKRGYNTIYRDDFGRPFEEQSEAFTDTWYFNRNIDEAIEEIQPAMRDALLDENAKQLINHIMRGLYGFDYSMLAYFIYMAERLMEMKRVLKADGSVYLHCDPTASHYLKILMDTIFGAENFRNEIVWHYTGGGRSKSYFSRKHDIILFYAKYADKMPFYVDEIRVPYKPTSGYAKGGITAKSGKHYEPHPDGTPVDDVWDIPIINPMSKERLGYPTQKPLALLQQIVKASSKEGDLVCDPFCGCATTIEAADRLKRNWIGIDISSFAIKRVSHNRLYNRLGLKRDKHYTIDGIPNNWEDAREMAEDHGQKGRFDFQSWAISEVGGFPSSKKSWDGGIDGRIYTNLVGTKEAPNMSMVLEVKSGRNVGPRDYTRLADALNKPNVIMAGLILLHPFEEVKMREFTRWAASYGHFEWEGFGKKFPKIQICTVQDIFEAGNPLDVFKVPGKIQGLGEVEDAESVTEEML